MTQLKLKQILKYNPNSGVFTWLVTSKNKKRKKGDLAGGITPDGYIRIGIHKKRYLAHRLAWLYVYGTFPSDQIDHINHDRTDNRIDNLRDVSNSENGKNTSLQINNTSGTIGVSWYKAYSKWKARIVIDGKDIHLGYFIEYHEAVNARKNAEALYGFHDNHGN